MNVIGPFFTSHLGQEGIFTMRQLLSLKWSCFVLLISASVNGLAGCGPSEPVVEYADVKGELSYNGEALPKGTITFQPEFGSRTVADIQPDGSYSMKAVVGKNTVMIESHEPGAEPGGPDAAKMMHSDPEAYIPIKYSAPSSGLTAEVKAGETNTIDFHVKE